VATSKLASDLSSGSKKPEPDKHVPISEIYSWASQLASESRKLGWVFYWYVWPDAVRELARKLETMNGGIIGLVGLQGVGKSSALRAILSGRMFLRRDEHRRTSRSVDPSKPGSDVALFKWRRQSELLPSLLIGTHELSSHYRRLYLYALTVELKARFSGSISDESEKNPERLNEDWATSKLGKARVHTLRQRVWLRMLQSKKVILIDTPDYSKTDRRLMAKDLEEIYWLWDFLSQPVSLEDDAKPNVVVAIQKEMYRDHFFFERWRRSSLNRSSPSGWSRLTRSDSRHTNRSLKMRFSVSLE
jgi:GTPase SAR1 family protein